MGCSGCSTGRGGSNPAGCKSNGNCSTGGCEKLSVFNWLSGIDRPFGKGEYDIVEIRFKNSRKEFFKNTDNLPLKEGDVVAVEAMSGHDIGTISLTGELVKTQINRKGGFDSKEVKKIYRHAKQTDLDKWQEAIKQEKETMYESRVLATELKLGMKISDVEYQGDKTKATFFYTADARVDFRELIKKMADKFKVRIEMRQIGARQEAGRLGGIGSCGRELCCSTWLTDFRSVSTSAARYQQLSLNPQKLAGQCGKLKCCLNFELDAYVDAVQDFPKNNVKLQTKKGTAVHQKTDIFKRIMWYSYLDDLGTFIPMEVDRVIAIIAQNEEGDKPDDLKDYMIIETVEEVPDYENVVGQDSLTRFDKKGGNKNKKGGNKNKKGGNKKRFNKNKGNKDNKNPNAKKSNPNAKKGGNKKKPNHPNQNNPNAKKKPNHPNQKNGGNKKKPNNPNNKSNNDKKA